MAKKIWGFFLIVLCSSISVASASVLQQVSDLEQATNLYTDDMYLINYYQELLEGLHDVCPAADIALAQSYVNQIVISLTRKYSGRSVSNTLAETAALHDSLLATQSKLNRMGGTYFCTLKYILFAVQDWLRDTHIELMEQSGIIRDFEGFELGGPIHGAQVKLEMLDEYIAELTPYASQLGMELIFKEGNSLVTNNNDWKKVGEKSKEIMKLTVYKALVELKKAGLFSDDDIRELNGKFTLHMHLSCDSFHGNYKVTETLNHHGHHVSFETDEVPLEVNACGNYFLLTELPYHFYKIVIHEMGHHNYYYNDRLGHDDFESLCRSGKTCSSSDFVSEYAKTNAIEDYAEHFMHWFLGILPENTPVLQKKTDHFSSM